jgi:hypothetical protein
LTNEATLGDLRFAATREQLQQEQEEGQKSQGSKAVLFILVFVLNLSAEAFAKADLELWTSF